MPSSCTRFPTEGNPTPATVRFPPRNRLQPRFPVSPDTLPHEPLHRCFAPQTPATARVFPRPGCTSQLDLVVYSSENHEAAILQRRSSSHCPSGLFLTDSSRAESPVLNIRFPFWNGLGRNRSTVNRGCLKYLTNRVYPFSLVYPKCLYQPIQSLLDPRYPFDRPGVETCSSPICPYFTGRRSMSST